MAQVSKFPYNILNCCTNQSLLTTGTCASNFFSKSLFFAANIFSSFLSVQYNANLVEPGSAVVVFDTSWVGNINQDMIAIQRQYVLNGRIDVGLTRIDHLNVSGFGQIGTCYIVIEDNIFEPPLIGDEKNGEETEMFMTIKRGQIIDNEENELPAFYLPTYLLILERIVDNVFESEWAKEIELFPNPVQEELFLNSNSLKINQVTIYDWTGKVILQKDLDNSKGKLMVNELTAGAYFIEIQMEKGSVFKRFVKE